MQEHQLTLVFGRIQVHVDAIRYFLGQRCQFEVVGCEHRKCTHRLAHVMRGRPGERQSVKGTRSASYLVHKDQALLSRVVQNGRGLGHFDHKSRAAAGQVIRCANAREYPVDCANPQAVSRDETADMREDDDQGGLPHVRRFTAHIRAGNDYESLLIMQRKIVGDEGSLDDLFDDQVPAAADLQARPLDDFRLAQV